MMSTDSKNITELLSPPASQQKRLAHIVCLALMAMWCHLVCYRENYKYFNTPSETSGRTLAVEKKRPKQEFTITHTNDVSSDDPHFSKVALLGLLPWERATMNATFQEAATRLAEDQLPTSNRNFMSSYCTLGTISKGLDVAHSSACHQTSGYDRVEQEAQALLSASSTSSCDICNIVEHFHRNETLHTLTFWGDSVQKQAFFGFLCELGRRNYQFNMTTNNPTKQLNNWSLRRIYTATITSPTWTTGTASLNGNINNSNNTLQNGVTLKFFFQYRPIRPMAALYNETMRPMLEAQTSVLVYNFGLHWNMLRRDMHKTHLEHVMDTLAQYGTNMSLIMFRETSAQHFLSAGGIGDYEKQDNSTSTSCGPHTTPTSNPIYGWRNKDAHHTFQEHQFFKSVMVHPNETAVASTALRTNKHAVGIMPFHDFSAARHDVHPEECTHFCHTPFLWMPLWRSLRLAMDAKFGDLEYRHQSTIHS